MDEKTMIDTSGEGGNVRSTIGKLGAACALLALIGGAAVQPALAHDRGGYGHRGGYGRGYGYDRHDWRGGGYYEPYPVYAPPPVYYPPQPSPGISLFFPIRIR